MKTFAGSEALETHQNRFPFRAKGKASVSWSPGTETSWTEQSPLAV